MTLRRLPGPLPPAWTRLRPADFPGRRAAARCPRIRHSEFRCKTRGLTTMKFLHTADWHIGKTLKGQSRLDEQAAVLKEIVELARTHSVDAVLLAGDLYE